MKIVQKSLSYKFVTCNTKEMDGVALEDEHVRYTKVLAWKSKVAMVNVQERKDVIKLSDINYMYKILKSVKPTFAAKKLKK